MDNGSILIWGKQTFTNYKVLTYLNSVKEKIKINMYINE